jgi:hypothetical protein
MTNAGVILTRHQRGLHRHFGTWWAPNASADGSSMGAKWTGQGTVTHPAPANTNAATQLRCTMWANAAANTDVGLRCNDASDLQFWAGNAIGLGGWYFAATFRIETWFANSGRLFVGMCNSNTGQVVNDVFSATDVIGLWHDTTMGANVLKLAARKNGVNGTFIDFTTFTLAAGQAFRFEMSQPGNFEAAGETCQVRAVLTSINTGDSSRQLAIFGDAYRNTVFLAPQVQVSSGADATANRFAIGVANVYVSGL